MGRTASVFVIAAAAFGAGAAAGLLFAPASGEENRKRFAGQLKAQTANIEAQIKEVEKSVSALEQQVREAGLGIGTRVKDAANSAVDKLLPEVPGDDSWRMESNDVTTDLPHLPKL